MLKIMFLRLDPGCRASSVALMAAHGYAQLGRKVAYAHVGAWPDELREPWGVETWHLPTEDATELGSACCSLARVDADVVVLDAPEIAARSAALLSCVGVCLAPVRWTPRGFAAAVGSMAKPDSRIWMVPVGIPGASAAGVVAGTPDGRNAWPFVLPHLIAPMSRAEEASILAGTPLPGPRRSGLSLASSIEMLVHGRGRAASVPMQRFAQLDPAASQRSRISVSPASSRPAGTARQSARLS